MTACVEAACGLAKLGGLAIPSLMSKNILAGMAG